MIELAQFFSVIKNNSVNDQKTAKLPGQVILLHLAQLAPHSENVWLNKQTDNYVPQRTDAQRRCVTRSLVW